MSIPASTFPTSEADGPQNANTTTNIPSNYEICDRTGFKVPAGTLRKEWNGLMVRPESWEPRHPQDFVRGHTETPRPSPRPEQVNDFIQDNDQVSASDPARCGVEVGRGVTLFARIEKAHGRLDVLVNSIAGEEPMMGQWGSFWTVDLTSGEAVFRQALLSHFVTAKHAAPLMMRRRRGLIVEVTEGDTLMAGANPMAHTVKLALKAFALEMAAELEPHGVAAVAVTPGFLRSESMLQHFGVTEANWRDAGEKDSNFLNSESPLFVGRAVAALAQDRRILERSGQLLSSWELARQYRFTDADGRRPDWGASKLDFSMFPPFLLELMRTGSRMQLAWLDAAMKRTKKFVRQLPPPKRAARD